MNKQIKLFAYIDICDNPITAWEVAIGRVASATFNKENTIPLSFWFLRLILFYIRSNYTDSRLNNDLRVELIRKEFFPSKVSRLKGVYFFQDYDSAVRSLDCWKNGNYNKDFIAEVNFLVNKLSYYDSDWITHNLKNKLQTSDEWIYNYLSGKPMTNSPSWEIIAEGIGYIVNEDLRRLAYSELMKKWPETSSFLNLCTYAFNYNFLDAGRITPSIIMKNNSLICTYQFDYEYMKLHKLEIFNSINMDFGSKANIPWISSHVYNSLFSLPDLNKILPKYAIKDQNIYQYFDRILHFVSDD